MYNTCLIKLNQFSKGEINLYSNDINIKHYAFPFNVLFCFLVQAMLPEGFPFHQFNFTYVISNFMLLRTLADPGGGAPGASLAIN